MEEIIRQSSSIIFGISFVWIGIQHFRDPEWFEPIVPSILGNPKFWVYFSGMFEIILGLGIIFPISQRIASLSIAIMLIILYWANLNMWINDIPIGGSKLSQSGHIIRGFIQLILIFISLWIGKWYPFSEKTV